MKNLQHVHFTSHWFRRIFTVTALCFFSLLPLACQPSIEVMGPASASPAPIATIVPAERALAVVAVDFDPPLEYSRIISNGGITLLVAIENCGRVAESDVEVIAKLYDASGPSEQVELLNEAATVRVLAAGEVRVVRFSQVTELPISTHYKLVVELAPVYGEIDTTDNVRTYDIVLRGGD